MDTPDLTDDPVILRPVNMCNISLHCSAGEVYRVLPLVRTGELVADKLTIETTRALIHWLLTTFPLAFGPARQAPITSAPADTAAQDKT